ncbi:MAG: ABC transporter ATP-binding protein [Clostridiales bacterium]|nr:ABC transporter ATP-binding protein [Clostridiales bacterium]
MGPGGPNRPGPGRRFNSARDELEKIKPNSIKEVPIFLKKLLSSFFFRLFYVFRLVWGTRPWILFVMLFMAIFNGVMPVISAYINAALLNSLAAAYIGEVGMEVIMKLLLLRFIHSFVNNLVRNINRIVTRIYGELVVQHIKRMIMDKARTIDLASFDDPEFYSRLENANNEAGHRPIQILESTFSIMSTVISMVSFIVILWGISPYAPLIIIALSIPSAIINFIYRRKNVNYIRHRSKERRQMFYYSNLMTNKDLVKEVRIFNLSDLFIESYVEVFGKYFAGLKKLYIEEGSWHIGLEVVSSVVNFLLYIFIAGKVVAGQIEVGDYSLYTGALSSISGGISSLINTTASIFEGTLFIDNLIAFMDEEQRIIPLIESPLKVKRHAPHEIEFLNVSFRYPGTERDVLKNINVKLEAGETIVLVGLNGAGKTTLLKLLTRLYDPTEGVILLDGEDIRNYDVQDLYSIFGIIFQDFGKYAFSVKQNIAFGDIDKPIVQEEIEKAARHSSADEFIQALPDGYNTPLMRYFEENGIELSIGMWQKLSIARAFYGDSDIVILDEPTASLDALAEQEVYNQFDRLREDKMTIFVSHRLSSATVADKIIVLKDGEVVELGNHRELMANEGEYYTLFTTQAKYYVTTDSDGTQRIDNGRAQTELIETTEKSETTDLSEKTPDTDEIDMS